MCNHIHNVRTRSSNGKKPHPWVGTRVQGLPWGFIPLIISNGPVVEVGIAHDAK